MKRTLSLKREALAQLSDADLTAVAGAAPVSSPLLSCFCVSNIGECATWSCTI